MRLEIKMFITIVLFFNGAKKFNGFNILKINFKSTTEFLKSENEKFQKLN